MRIEVGLAEFLLSTLRREVKKAREGREEGGGIREMGVTKVQQPWW